jgi:hypothetical protein
MPIFQGFTAPRYQQHDALIKALVKEFNSNKSVFISGSAAQAAKIPDLSEEIIKSWIIEISGGNDASSISAWNVDPARVNLPGEWSVYKQSLGLKLPLKCNEGTVEQNLRAAIIWLARKGFGDSGQPPASRQRATFDGWQVAIQRYNTRKDAPKKDKLYSQEHSQHVVNRIITLSRHVPIKYPRKS